MSKIQIAIDIHNGDCMDEMTNIPDRRTLIHTHNTLNGVNAPYKPESGEDDSDNLDSMLEDLWNATESEDKE